jgi:hypothetical protein
MSGYDPHAGWTHFTPLKLGRYFRAVDGQSNILDTRLDDSGLDWYRDVAGGIHVHCDDGRLWEVLSGLPATRSSARPDDPLDAQEWINVTDVGQVMEPPLPTSTVLRYLREEGLLLRVDGKDVPSPAAEGLFEERLITTGSGRFGSDAVGKTQRRWSYEVLARIRRRALNDVDNSSPVIPSS